MKIVAATNINNQQKEAIYRLWNNEYPSQLGYGSITGLDAYLRQLNNPSHYFAVDDNGTIQGWAFSFERGGEKWFAIIIDNLWQNKGIGSSLLSALKNKEPTLNGWVVDHNSYKKNNGTPYMPPAEFYIKNGSSREVGGLKI